MTEKTLPQKEIPQFNLPQILFMYAWPIAWFMFLIYVVGPYFVTPDGTFPLWAENLIGLLGNGAEITVAILILRREGYQLTFKDLRNRINFRFPDKLWKWGLVSALFYLHSLLFWRCFRSKLKLQRCCLPRIGCRVTP